MSGSWGVFQAEVMDWAVRGEFGVRGDDLSEIFDRWQARLGPADETVAISERLMTLWQEPWSEQAYGEAQMLLAQLRRVVR